MNRRSFSIKANLVMPALSVILLALPGVALAGAQDEWAQMRQACINSGGQAASAYNTWATQGCICNGRPSGQRTCSGGSSGTGGSGSLGTRPEQIIINGIIQELFRPARDDSAQRAKDEARAADLRRQSEDQAARQRRQAEEESARQAAERTRRDEEARDRLLGKSSDPSALSLMGVDSSSDLKLMTSEQQSSASDGNTSASLQLMTEDQQSNTSDRNTSSGKKGSKTKAYGYSKGFEHASQCISQNSIVCTGAPKEQQGSCADDYRAGYAAGDKQRVLAMREASQAGMAAAKSGEDNRGGFNDARAVGPCRQEWIDAYRRGHEKGSSVRAPQ